MAAWLRVNLKSINREFFIKPRDDEKQNAIRNIILEAFEEADKNPGRYDTFETLEPEKTWPNKTIKELKGIVHTYNGNISNWVEQALEWAQIISNVGNWNICKNVDSANWFRLITWKEGEYRLVGGASRVGSQKSPVEVHDKKLSSNTILGDVVPKIVRR